MDKVGMLWLFKLTVTPVLVGCMSLAVRYWGPTLGSILIGLPWMTGPVLFILGLERGNAFVAETCIGVHLGVVALAAYVWGYTLSARRYGWMASQAVGSLAFIAASVALLAYPIAAAPAAILAALSLIAVYALIRVPPDARVGGVLPWWDIPARMLAAALLVLVISLLADILGPVLSGLIATYPVIMTVIGTFTHAQWGGGAAIMLMRAVLLSLLSFVAFFVVVEETIMQVGLVPSYLWAALASVVVSTSMLVLRRKRMLK